MNIKQVIKIVIVVFVLSCVIVWGIFSNYVGSSVDFQDRQITVEIPKGTTFSRASGILEKVDLIKHKKLFYFLAVLEDAPENIRAGEYELRSSMTPKEILGKLLKGEIKGYHIPIPEGFTVRQIAARLSAWKLVNEDKFMTLATDRDFLRSLNIPGKSAEGYLFPDTYIFDKSMREKEIIKCMARQFREEITPEMVKRAGDLGFTMEEIITLASIIEKEGGLKEEKPLVAAVFDNRLKKGMRLQSDPTVIYDIENFDGNITKKDLRRKTPYNTYRIKGLPPGPICNPGIDAISAALFPAQVNYLYFVSKNDGSHHFSSNLVNHNKAVVKYQIKRKR